MAKTIKFNLVLDNYPVRTVEELQEHFSIEDMLHYYKNGLLRRWLDARGYAKQCADLSSIKPDLPDKEIVKELAQVFEIKISPKDVDKAVAILDYLEQQKKREVQYSSNAKSTRQIINDYFNNYNVLVRHIEANCEKIGILKAAAAEIERIYFRLFNVNRRALLYRLKETAPKMIYALLTREALRQYIIGEDADGEVRKIIKTSFASPDFILKTLGEDAIVVKQNTDGNWDSIEPRSRRVMVLSLYYGSFIRNAERREEKLGQAEINGEFRLLNGIDYQNKNNDAQLIYMEV